MKFIGIEVAPHPPGGKPCPAGSTGLPYMRSADSLVIANGMRAKYPIVSSESPGHYRKVANSFNEQITIRQDKPPLTATEGGFTMRENYLLAPQPVVVVAI